MSGSSQAMGLALALALVGAFAFAFLMEAEEADPREAAVPSAPSATPVPQPSASASPADSGRAGPRAADADLEAALDAFLAAVPVQAPPRPQDVLAKAGGGAPLGPVDYRLELEQAIRAHRDGPAEAARMLVEEMTAFDATYLFQTSIAVASRLDEAGTRVLLDGLGRAEPHVRPHLVFALRGSDADEVEQVFVDLYTRDADPTVRARAAYAIGERSERLDPLLLERARQRARDGIRSDDPAELKAATDVLGTAPIEARDQQLLLGILAGDANPQRRMSALQALATAKVPPGQVAPVLEGIVAESDADPQLRQMAETALQALAGQGQ